jgi:NADPH:quinone reductase-like Zn-dependent oxidoreductase
MKAVVFRDFGPPEVLRLEEVPTPQPRSGHVLVKVLATGLNRLEDYLRAGAVTRELALPHVLGSDCAGEVAALGAGVSGFRVGERVVPLPGFPLQAQDADFAPLSAAPSYAIGGILRWGTYAQYVEVPARWLLRDDTGLSPEEMATLPMVLVTAVRAVKTVGEAGPGKRVLVHAGASGTGSMNIQVARSLGSRVATTVDDDDKAAFARELGAELVVDVRRDDFVARVREWSGGGADVVIDNLGGTVLPHSLQAARVGGTVVAMGFVTGQEATIHVREFFFTHKRLLGTLMGDMDDFRWGLEQVRAGRIKPLLDRTFPLAEAAEAHRRLAANRARGNFVLLPWAA